MTYDLARYKQGENDHIEELSFLFAPDVAYPEGGACVWDVRPAMLRYDADRDRTVAVFTRENAADQARWIWSFDLIETGRAWNLSFLLDALLLHRMREPGGTMGRRDWERLSVPSWAFASFSALGITSWPTSLVVSHRPQIPIVDNGTEDIFDFYDEQP